MRKYYMYYYRDFANTYTLLYAESSKDYEALKKLEDVVRITRKEAEHRARENKVLNDRFASHEIIPAHIYMADDLEPYNHGYRLRGVIYEPYV